MPIAVPTAALSGLVVGRRARADAEHHLAGALPLEGAGLLVGRVRLRAGRSVALARAFVPLANRAADGRRRFLVDARDLAPALAAAARRQETALAVVHGHPGGTGRASAADAMGAWPELLTVVVAAAGPKPAWRAYRTAAGGQRVLWRVAVVFSPARRSRRPDAGAVRAS
jgi:proteasome lid subunit RPN8/RPN11